MAELNALFGLYWRETDWPLPLDEPQAAIEEIVGNLYGDDPRLVCHYEVAHVPGRGRRLVADVLVRL